MRAIACVAVGLSLTGAAARADGIAGPSSARSPIAVPGAVSVARAAVIPPCTLFVDAAATGAELGTVGQPFKTIGGAVAAAPAGAIICVAQGTYAEALRPGTKYFTLAGGFQHGASFKVRDSATYVSKALGKGGSFIRIEDPGPTEGQLTAIDGFEITGYAQAIYRNIYYSQRFDLTNNYIHNNNCKNTALIGGGFSLNNVTGTIQGNVFANNTCTRGGAGALGDSTHSNSVTIAQNLFTGNLGTETQIGHGGGLYLFATNLAIVGNTFVGNRVTGWGGGLYVGAFTGGGLQTNATLNGNIYRRNRAGVYGGGFFCDDSASCVSNNEIYDSNCGGNIYLDGGPGGSGPTRASFDHLTNVRARKVGCVGAGPGVQITKNNDAPDAYSFTDALFWGNATGLDFDASCGQGCNAATVTVTYSMVQTLYANGGMKVTFGSGVLPPKGIDFVAPATGDFHLKSRFGHYTDGGYVTDAVTSSALAKGDPNKPAPLNPPRAGTRSELGAFGNSPQASYVK